MIILILFAFLAGIATILSPCILPVLPVVLSGSVGFNQESKLKPYGVVIGFVLSFTFFTLFFSTLVKYFGIPTDILRITAIGLITIFGFILIIPSLQKVFEKIFTRLARFMPATTGKSGFSAGLLLGLSIGILWTPCVGPILASVISLAIIGEVTLNAVFITLAYSMGTAIPMFFIIVGGRNALQKVPWLTRNLANIQRLFGVLMILTALAIALDYDRKFQTFILVKFPNYGTGLTKLEDNKLVQRQLVNVGEGFSKQVQNTGEETIVDGEGKEVLPKLGQAPELIPGGEWFNSKPLKLSELRGKVVLLDFWTYSCINCQRTFPYLRSWWEKYNEKGLVIIGVHSPEFEFEKDVKNVAKAIDDFGLKYPVVQDNDFRTWRAYNNRYWPAKYIIDHEGYVRYTHFGEGKYDETELVIQTLLMEAGLTAERQKVDNPKYTTYARTPELYLGFSRMKNFASPEDILANELGSYTKPEKVPDNFFAWDGEGLISEEYTNPKQGVSLHLNFESKEVFLVMNPKGEESRIRVFVDGEVQYLGNDVDSEGVVTIDSDSLYKLIKLEQPGRHLLRIEFLDDNTEVYAFTFG